ncbi:MAG: hypothetical protein ACREEB_11355 [Caulobacteraceae bacterium]
MRKTLILAAIAALAFTSIADAKTAPAKGMTTAQPTRCHNAKGHVIRCPAVAAASAKPAAQSLAVNAKGTPLAVNNKGGTLAVSSTPGAPHCTKGKPCGHSCIAMDKVCHK